MIIATGLDEQRLGLFLGANDYLVKPVAKSQLLQAIQRVSLDPKRSIQNVAVVDDDPSMLRLVARILEKEHYKVWTFESGEAFLASLATQRPDTVIVDLLMPHMDGFQLIETLREHPACSDVPVMVMTAKVLSEDDLLRLNHRVRAVIQKDGTACEEAFHQLVNQLQLMETRRGNNMPTILLVEDDPLNQTVVKDIFRYDNLPGELVCVGSAEEALRILPSLDPLVVLMDLMLPGMSGIEATRIIKGDPATKAHPGLGDHRPQRPLRYRRGPRRRLRRLLHQAGQSEASGRATAGV